MCFSLKLTASEGQWPIVILADFLYAVNNYGGHYKWQAPGVEDDVGGN